MATNQANLDVDSRPPDTLYQPLPTISRAKRESSRVEPSIPDVTGGIIPYKNPAALFAYYLGVLSVLPVIGAFFGVPAFILGIVGLENRRRTPVIKGSVHAWIGIVVGGLCSLIWSAVLILIACCLLLYGPQLDSLLRLFGG